MIRSTEKFLFVTCLIVKLVSSKNVNDYEEFCSINTKSGRIRGKLNRTLFEEVPYYSFRAIPFAKPPIGKLRFKAPQKTEPWNGTLEATEYQNDCLQARLERLELFGSEDCLYLNVFVPARCSSLNPTTKLPVIVFVYGGVFYFGSPRLYLPDFFMETNVIIVSFNFRSDIFGFLSLNTPEYSGNMGLKDQVLALRWVNEHIEYFGGDKKKITLFGHSTGATSVNWIMASPTSKNLFQKSIVMSPPLMFSLLPGPNDHFSVISYLAAKMFYPISDKTEAIKFLQQVDGKQLVLMVSQDYNAWLGRKTFTRIFFPRVEAENAIDPFLTESPFDILTNPNYRPDIDTMFMNSPNEYIFAEFEWYPALMENFDRMFQFDLPIAIPHLDWSSEDYKRISNDIRMFYLNGKHANRQTLPQMNKLTSDCRILYPVDLSARIQATKSIGRTFFSRFAVDNDFNQGWKEAKLYNISMGATHLNILYYIFRTQLYPETLGDEEYRKLKPNSFERNLIKSTTNFFVNFAKYSNPMPGSDPVSFRDPNTDHYSFYHITNDGIRIETDIDRDRMEFWNDIYNENKQLLNTDFDFRTAHTKGNNFSSNLV